MAISFSVEDSLGGVETYDAVVLACHADQALALIETPTAAESAILGAFEYQSNDAVLHSDPNLMPKRRAIWSSWNYLANSTKPRGDNVSITYWMNHLQGLETDRLALLSLNPLKKPDDQHIVARMRYDHPLFDQKALDAQGRLSEIQGRHRLWFAGAHWGFGFHEDGLLSGLQVAASFGVAPPWWPNVRPLKIGLPTYEQPRLSNDRPRLTKAAAGGD